MLWILVVLAALAVVVIGLVVVGRETDRLVHTAKPAVFDLAEAVNFIAEHLPEEVAGRITHDDVRWVLLTDADLLEEATADVERDEELPDDVLTVIDPDRAVALILGRAEDEERDLEDLDVVAVLDGRTAYLEAIGAIGPEVDDAPGELA